MTLNEWSERVEAELRRDNLRRLARHGLGWDRPRTSHWVRLRAWWTRTLGLVRSVERPHLWQ